MPIICEKCKVQPASVHLTEVIQDDRKELHVCEACARQLGIVQKLALHSIPELLEKLGEPKPKKAQKEFSGLKCAHCGLTYADFRSRGRFGCAQDFAVFAPGLEPLLEKIHGATRHAGRAPGGAPPTTQEELVLWKLRRELDACKKAENFERCAQVRDEIQKLEEKIGRGIT